MRFAPIIGLEIHVRLKTKTKMYCRCALLSDIAAPNQSICPVCTGQPGALPAVNEAAVRLGVRTGLALNCTIPEEARFDRKHYFYPDLPKGYQITQNTDPIAKEGFVEIPTNLTPTGIRVVGIERAHLEEDAGKNIHDANTNSTFVDFNRAGAPLLEVVTKPDLRSPEEARLFLQELQTLLRSIGASEADMEKGHLRCDANISLIPVDDEGLPLQKNLNPKVEVKNMNSFRSVERAIAFEIERQSRLLEQGITPEGETRGWNDQTNETLSQRKKETGADYRYFPEPDLPALQLRAIEQEERHALPELPGKARQRFMSDYELRQEEADFFAQQPEWGAFFEAVTSELDGGKTASDDSSKMSDADWRKLVSSWIIHRYAPLLQNKQKTLAERPVDAENMAEFIHLIGTGAVTSTNATKLLTLMVETSSDPSHLLEEHDLGQSVGATDLEALVATILEQNPTQVEQVKAGKLPVIKWLVGCVMRSSEGRANPVDAEQEVKKQLGIS